MLANSLTRARLRIGLIIVILATIPIYCGGLVMVQYAKQPKATPTSTIAPMPTATTPSIMIATPYPTFTASLTLVGPTDTPIPSATKPQTNTPSPTESPTETVTQTATPTSTLTPSVTPSETLQPTNTPTSSQTLTPSYTLTMTPSQTPTWTATITLTQTLTITTTLLPSETP